MSGFVEIKLCIKQETVSENASISAELFKDCLLGENYSNPDLTVRVQYSAEPYPGETSKLSYRNLTGSIPLFFQSQENKTAESSLNQNTDPDPQDIPKNPLS